MTLEYNQYIREECNQAYRDGYRAYQDRKCKYDHNPYKDDYEDGVEEGNKEWHLYFAWRDGYESAAWDD